MKFQLPGYPFSKLHWLILIDDATPPMIWSSVEISVGIGCACLPAMVPVLQLFSSKLRVAASQRPPRRESGGLWYAQSIAGARNQENKPDRDGIYGTWDEELATLRPAYDNGRWSSNGFGMRYGTGSSNGSSGAPIATSRSTNSSS